MPLTERDVNAPLRTPPARKAPPPPSTSKLPLPRRVLKTPETAPASTPWTSYAVGSTLSTNRSVSDLRQPPVNKRDSISIRSYQKMRKINTPKTDKPLPVDKPLPARPIARLSSLPSPSKDSRGLIDASEIPLHFTATNGDTQEWPTLEPSPANSTRSATPVDFPFVDHNASLLESSPLPAPPVSVYAAETKLTEVITGRQSFQDSHRQTHRTSPASSYASAVERSSSVQGRDEHDVEVMSTGRNVESPPVEEWNSSSAGVDLPPRKASLHNRISSGHIVPPSPGSAQKFMGLTDFTKDQSSTPSSPESHSHTFSRASFSQLRPGAGSECNTSPKTLKTASRIPISDAQKATVVDVRKNRLSASSMPRAGMSFGSRRLASPDALKILENGKMRRQLKRATDENTSVVRLERTWTSGSSATTVATNEIPSLSHSLNSSPDHTLAPNPPDVSHSAPSSTQNHQLPQSWTKPTYVGKHDTSRLPGNRTPSFHEDMFEDQAYSSARLPPQTSPFTEPLQTIPSEAALLINSAIQERKPSSEFTRTLSRLEGRDTPQVPEFDSQTFMQHYGHLTRKHGCNSHHNDTIMENAAAAEKFLAQRQTNGDMNGLLPRSQSTEETDVAFEAPEKPHDSHAEYKISIPVSKWSESTPSDKGLSPPDEGLLIGQESPTNRLPQKSYISKDLPDVPESIRLPSRLPAWTHGAGHQAPRQSMFRTFARRKSSPTLGQPKTPGSVRAAREGLQESTPSFARTTASAESKKSTKMPTPNTKKYTVPENAYESRKSVVERSKPKDDGTPRSKTPRSRSKSRYVMDKINGMFSGRREKKSWDIPPIPDREEVISNSVVEMSADGSPMQAVPATPQLPKMPSLSPSTQLALRSASRMTTITDDTSFVDRFTAQGDSQSVQQLSEHILGKARKETNAQRKERLLNFAKVLNDSLINAREAQISAETAQYAAKSAQVSYEMTQKSLAMLQRLAVSVASGRSRNRR